MVQGSLADSVSGTWDSWSQGFEFKPHAGCRQYLKFFKSLKKENKKSNVNCLKVSIKYKPTWALKILYTKLWIKIFSRGLDYEWLYKQYKSILRYQMFKHITMVMKGKRFCKLT